MRPLDRPDFGLQFGYNWCMNAKKPRIKCPVCGEEPARSFYKYCSNACQMEFQHRMHVENWKRGETTGLNAMGLVSASVKLYLRKKYSNKCCICGWAEVNLKTGVVPLVADHIDGNWRNNVEDNLRLICPNCDSLSPTYAGSNKGRGRKNRTTSKRVLLAKILRRKTSR